MIVPTQARSKYRPDPQRCVEVYGDFSEELSSELLSKITALTHVNSDPITVYINSLGGSTRVFEILEGALHGKTLDQKQAPWVITVAAGNAASAGAYLLACGNYAYAYEHSLIHFHGVRISDLPATTFESASQTASDLDRYNRRTARKLAEAIIGRVVFRYQMLKNHFDLTRKDESDKQLIAIRCFVDEIYRGVSPPTRWLVEKTFNRVRAARFLSDKILSKIVFKKKRTPVEDDAKVLTALIKHEVAENKGRTWRLDERGIQQLVADYFVLRDYNVGDHWPAFREVSRVYGREFLTEPENKEFEKLMKTDQAKAKGYMTEQSLPRLLPLWYFTVSLCSFLLEGENELRPTDAYWIGVVDEVVGTELEGARIVSETAEQPAVKEPFSTTGI